MSKNEKPILFNTEMVKAILDDRKNQTRRAIKIKNKLTRDWAITTGVEWLKVDLKDEKYPYSIREQNGAWNEYSLQDFIKKYSQYQVGDILWVRESAKIINYIDFDTFFEITYQFSDGTIGSLTKEDLINKHKLDDYQFEKKYLGKRYLINEQKVPNGCLKEMARIFLKVTNVRVERLQDISYDDIYNEGCTKDINIISEDFENDKMLQLWANLWDSTAKDGYKWEDNPYVFVYEFERV